MILGDLLARHARHDGGKTALVFEDRRYTHAEFLARVYGLANFLVARGLRRQDRVAVLARNCNEYLEAFGAGEVSGFITVNLNHRLSPRELVEIAKDCTPSVLIFAAEFADAARVIADAVPEILCRIALDAPVDGAETYEAALAASPSSAPALRAQPDDIAYLIYTSGTTGRPKGVMIDHHAMLEAARIQAQNGTVQADAVSLIVMPLFHIGAKIEHMTFSFLGGTIVLHRSFEPKEVLASIVAKRITCAHFAPVMIQRLLEEKDLSAYDLASLRNVHYASAPMPVPLLRRALAHFGPIFTQVYGMTECVTISTLTAAQHRPEGSALDLRRLASAGQPLLGCEVKVVRPDGTECAPGEIGEVVAKTAAVMRGYWNNHAATIETLRDGWMHTKDLGFFDEDCYLFIVDRLKDMIISGGENIYSWEVEEALRAHPAVEEASVIGVPDPEWGEAVKACVVLRAGRTAAEDELIAHCKAKLASYKKPRSIDFVAALPRLFNGKIDKKALRAAYWQGRERQVS